MTVLRAAASVVLAVLAAAGCQAPGSDTPAERTSRPPPTASPSSTATTSSDVRLPPTRGRFSYQIGGAYPAAAGVAVVARDRAAPPEAGAYSICYVNAFQAQADAVTWWRTRHPDLLLVSAQGGLVVDRDWDEPLLDISTAEHRTALAAVVGGWIDACARAGYFAVELDNLDSYTRSGGRLDEGDALAFAGLLAKAAHRVGVAAAQKNAAELSTRARAAGLDFAVVEECGVHDECGVYTDVYGAHVLDVEYTDQPTAGFATACAARPAFPVTRRDRDVLPEGQDGHVERWCPGR